jgi:hypothetical protein
MDGIMEHTNHLIAQILQTFIASNQKDWVKFLALVEFAINSTINRAMGIAPFKVNYGFLPQMMQELPSTKGIPPGVCTFTMNALWNMAVTHDSIIAKRVFQQHYANKHQCDEPNVKQGDLVYLSTKNLMLPKGCTSKLLPKFVGPYKVLQALPKISNYVLDLPKELEHWRLHQCFHVSLLRPHHPNDDALFPNRCYPDAYDFSALDNAEWYVEEIMAHKWCGCLIQFEVKWSLGNTTWEPLANCNDLAALDAYLALIEAKDCQDLPRCIADAAHWHS